MLVYSGRFANVVCIRAKCVSAYMCCNLEARLAGELAMLEAGKQAQDPGRDARETEGMCWYSRDLQMCVCEPRVLCVCFQ